MLQFRRSSLSAHALMALAACFCAGQALALAPKGYPVKPPDDPVQCVNETIMERTHAMYRLAASTLSSPSGTAPPKFIENWKREYEKDLSDLMRTIKAEKIPPKLACVLLLERQWESEGLLRDTYNMPPLPMP